jgi:hypothetical protein
MIDGYREIDFGDWRVRVIGIAALAVAGALVWALGGAVQRHVAELQAAAATNPEAAARRAAASLRALLSILTAGNVAVAAYLAWLGIRVVASDRLPPPGSWIIKGRAVYTGKFAGRIGRLFIVLAVLLVGASFALFWIGWRLTAV